MENKFVSSKELEDARVKRQEEWKKAFERIGEKPPPIEENYDPRTLYERLQEQKVKKEEAFQEMTRFSNLIHRLDEDEIEFLATLESEERVKDLEKTKRDEEEIEKFRRAAAEADKAVTSKPIIHHESVPLSAKVNTLKRDSQQMILANAVKKTVKPTRKKSLPVTIKQGPLSPQESSSPKIGQEISSSEKTTSHDSDEYERENKRIRIEKSNDSLSPKKETKYNEKIVIEEKDFAETKSSANNSNPLSSLLVYSDNSSDDDIS
ncbi:N-terminal domain of NEFA-interacting nuclear protein NIP30-domain-containing protein [Glomus cerebriforme]|uniref:N-terminal domain of NEFA-interacting nuclear protein NIP30-domain-containing protein n=1 Tax=Glomus cerebriforme TaxID=658196 RepID=A0A397TCM1_9GLOM|nr:N-terminal domain of NEFA-interacting nuclear protein NIP30-domain-containing protein [Glomus cerebriforme]